MQKPRILILSGYEAASHRLWRETLEHGLDDFQWHSLSLDARHFAWRIRGNSLIWAMRHRRDLEQPFDGLIATSMVDLAALRGLIPALSRLPTLLYFHENQFDFPENGRLQSGQDQPPAFANVEQQLVPVYSALCAQQLLFNSEFNKQGFFKGCEQLLQRLPDRLSASVLQQLPAAAVMPVPLQLCNGKPRRSPNLPLELLWNHRWEYDKGPALLLALVEQIRARRSPLRLHVVGQQFRQQPAEFKQIDGLLQQHADDTGIERGRFGFVPSRDDYESLLGLCDVALSTADHDFQGLALQEAVLAGCSPLAPDALVYPEYLPAQYLYPRHQDTQQTALAIMQKLEPLIALKSEGETLPRPDLTSYRCEQLLPRYRDLIRSIIGG